MLHFGAISRNADIYPPYYKLLEAKKACYPAGIEISDLGVQIPLQNLLDITVYRFLQICDKEVLEKIVNRVLIMTTKWGMDGTANLSAFKKILKMILEILRTPVFL